MFRKANAWGHSFIQTGNGSLPRIIRLTLLGDTKQGHRRRHYLVSQSMAQLEIIGALGMITYSLIWLEQASATTWQIEIQTHFTGTDRLTNFQYIRRRSAIPADDCSITRTFCKNLSLMLWRLVVIWCPGTDIRLYVYVSVCSCVCETGSDSLCCVSCLRERPRTAPPHAHLFLE